MSWLPRIFQGQTESKPVSSMETTQSTEEVFHGGMVQVHTLDSGLLPTLKSHDDPGRRLVIVGDVHGCLDEPLLAKIKFQPSLDHLILTGDMINKGPSSQGVIHFCRSIHASAVRGNHEDKMLRAHASLRTVASNSEPASDGDTAVEALARQFSKSDIAWIASRPLILSLGKIRGLPYANTVIVHAGLVPGTSLEAQSPFFVMNMRSIDESTMEPREKRDDGTKWWKVWNEVQERLPEEKRSLVVYGHDSKQGLVKERYSMGLDSGCVKGGRLSALVIGPDGKSGRMKMEVESVKCRGYV